MPWAIALSIFLAVLSLLSCLALLWPSGPSQVRAPEAVVGRRNPLMTLFAMAGQSIPRSERETAALRTRLVLAGTDLSQIEFVGMKVFSTAAVVMWTAVILREFHALSLLAVLLAAAVGFLIPDLWLRSRIKKRQRATIRLLPEVVDLLALCIGAGLDFLTALNRVVGLKRFGKEPFIEELSMALQEMKLGKRRAEALRSMSRRLNLPEVTSFVRTLVQADRMGTPIGEALAINSEDVRLQYFMRAERQALKAPIKILVPLIFCIMPCVAIMVIVPVLLQFMQQKPFGR